MFVQSMRAVFIAFFVINFFEKFLKEYHQSVILWERLSADVTSSHGRSYNVYAETHLRTHLNLNMGVFYPSSEGF